MPGYLEVDQVGPAVFPEQDVFPLFQVHIGRLALVQRLEQRREPGEKVIRRHVALRQRTTLNVRMRQPRRPKAAGELRHAGNPLRELV